MDFFTVPTVTFSVLYCFFIIGHDRRRILHFNVTRHPTSGWIVQQLREAFPYEPAIRFLLFDHDAKYGIEVPARDSLDGHHHCENSSRLPLAKWCGRTLGRHLSSRTTGPRDCLQPVAYEAATCFLRRLLPSGSHPLRTAKADSRYANALGGSRKNYCVAACRWSSSSLRPGCVDQGRA